MSIKDEIRNSLKLSDLEESDKVDWEELRILMGNLGHEVRRNGKEAFMKLHADNIEEFRKDWTHIQFCYLLGFMGTIDPTFSYDESVKTDKYVILELDRAMLDTDEEDTYEALNEIIDRSDESFLKRGFLFFKD